MCACVCLSICLFANICICADVFFFRVCDCYQTACVLHPPPPAHVRECSRVGGLRFRAASRPASRSHRLRHNSPSPGRRVPGGLRRRLRPVRPVACGLQRTPHPEARPGRCRCVPAVPSSSSSLPQLLSLVA